ncbi:MAG: SEL1-like repeat protein [Pseudohongiellaceae bacterium]
MIIRLSALVAVLVLFVSCASNQDYAREEQYRLAAEQGDPHDQYTLGYRYYNGQGVPQDYVEAVRWYRMAAEQGDTVARYNLGFMYEYGKGVAQDFAEADRLYRLAADMSHAGAMYSLNPMYRIDKMPHYFGYAVRWYDHVPPPTTGQSAAAEQFQLGVSYYTGEDEMPEDVTEAVRRFHLAAEQGFAPAQLLLGFMYEDGKYEEDEDADDADVEQDYAEAARWYQLAAEQGNAIAQNNLGHLYEYGQGVPQDYAEARRWHQLAAAQNHVGAQYALGVMYNNGKGVPQDYIEAYIWFSLAVASGGSDSIALTRDEARSHLSSAELDAAQREAARRYAIVP